MYCRFRMLLSDGYIVLFLSKLFFLNISTYQTVTRYIFHTGRATDMNSLSEVTGIKMFQCFARCKLNHWWIQWDREMMNLSQFSIRSQREASGISCAAEPRYELWFTPSYRLQGFTGQLQTPHTHTHDPHFSTCDSDVAYGRSSGQGTQGTTLLSLFSICLFNRTMISFPARDTGDRVVHLSGTTIRTLHINAVRCSIHFYIRCKQSLFLKKATRYIWNRMIFRSDLFKSLHPHGLTMLSSDACNMQKMLEK